MVSHRRFERPRPKIFLTQVQRFFEKFEGEFVFCYGVEDQPNIAVQKGHVGVVFSADEQS